MTRVNLKLLGAKGWGRRIVRGFIQNTGINTGIFKMHNQQGSTVEHTDLCSGLRGSLDGRGVWGRIGYVCFCLVTKLCPTLGLHGL